MNHNYLLISSANKMSKQFLLVVLLFSAFSCTKDRSLFPKPDIGNPDIEYGIMRINEVVSRGSLNANEYGVYSDWFEIFNRSGKNIVMEKGKWYVSDNPAQPLKYELPQVTVNSMGYLIIWCDGTNLVGTQIHTNFGLNSSGETIGLYYRNSPTEATVVIDTLTYPGDIPKGMSYGMVPDGSDNWYYLPVPTPGYPNHY